MRNNLILWDPFKELLDTTDMYDRFLAGNHDPARSLLGMFGKGYDMPAVDIYDKKDHIVAQLEVPGLEKKDLKVSVDSDVLKITGEKKK
ncbi:MAG: Hsp20/alpha crystallin family protein [Elusimicrobiota bacterium]